MWKNDKPSGTWTWYYDNGQKEAELEFDEEYPVYFTSWYNRVFYIMVQEWKEKRRNSL